MACLKPSSTAGTAARLSFARVLSYGRTRSEMKKVFYWMAVAAATLLAIVGCKEKID